VEQGNTLKKKIGTYRRSILSIMGGLFVVTPLKVELLLNYFKIADTVPAKPYSYKEFG
jgi:hypothetical protein